MRTRLRFTLVLGRCDPIVVPGSEIEECPDIEAVIAPSGPMFCAQITDERSLEPTSFHKRRRQYFSCDALTEFSPHPITHRRAEAHLLSIDDFIWDPSLDGKL